MGQCRVRPGVQLSEEADSHGVVGSVSYLTDNGYKGLCDILSRFPDIDIILIAGGSPCVSFAPANPNRKGINDPESNKLWVTPGLAAKAQSLRPLAKVMYFAENAQVSEELGSRQVNQVMASTPVIACASAKGPALRVGSFWSNMVLGQVHSVETDVKDFLDVG